MDFDFSDICFFSDNDLKEVLPILVEEPTIQRITRYFSPGITDEEFRTKWLSFKTIEDFQFGFIVPLMEKIIKDSSHELNGINIDGVDITKPYLFITNHRNIVMDAALLNILLYRKYGNKLKTTAIAIGNNLLTIPWVRNIARMNKSFVVERDTTVQQMLESSKRLSAYIRNVIGEQRNSIWIAQREGRTKDGNDQTQTGLLKMFKMSGPDDFVENFSQLNIMPVSISYEFDPNEKQKLIELATIESGVKYEKAPMEDFNSMFQGIMGQKGRIQYHFGEVISEEILRTFDGQKPINEKVKALADYIDNFVYNTFRLWSNNYIAADLLNNNDHFSNYYSQEEKSKFVESMNEIFNQIEISQDFLKPIYLKMYANPVKNRFIATNPDLFSF